MKLRRIILPLVALSLTGCTKKPLVIPTVDVDKVKVNLPSITKRNTGTIKNDSNYEYIDLYELSDFHGAVNYEKTNKYTYVGLKKLSTYFENKRKTNPGGTIILSSGDMFQGSAESNLTRGYMVNYCMQYMGFDAMAIGNHEFDWTDTWLKKNAELKYNTSTIPYLGANITKKGVMPSFIKKSTIIKRGNYKIGVIGVIGSELEDSILKSAVKDYEFAPYKTIVENEAQRLREQEACNSVILLAHVGADQIGAINGIDAAFGGHDHDDVQGTVGTAPSVATKNYGQSVARMTLKFNKSTKAFVETLRDAEPWDKMSSIAPSLAEDKNITAIINSYSKELDKIKNIKLGSCDEDLVYNGALANIATKSMHESAVKFVNDNKGYKINANNVICALTNSGGGIRSDISKGKILYNDVYRSFPFDNELVLVQITGQELREKLSKVGQLAIYRTFEYLSEIKSSNKYYVVTTDYLALNKQFEPLKKVEDKDMIRTGKILRDEVAYKIYEIDKVKISEWESDDICFSPVQ